MLTGDDKLDALNVAVAEAFTAWKAEQNATTTAALAKATDDKAAYLKNLHETARTEYMRKFMASR